MTSDNVLCTCNPVCMCICRPEEARKKEGSRSRRNVTNQTIILDMFKGLWIDLDNCKKRKETKREKQHVTWNYFFSWSLSNPSIWPAYLRSTFNNSFMPEHSCLFWENVWGHEEHEIHLPAYYKGYRSWMISEFNVRGFMKKPDCQK